MDDCKLVRVLTAICCEPWLITPTMHKTITEIACSHAFGGEQEARQHEIAATFTDGRKGRAFQLVGSTAVIPIEGVIGRKYSDSLHSSGVVSIDVLDRILQAAEMDESVDSVLMVFDSPGGIAMGVPEVAATINRVKQGKPVVAFADGLMCSAAYWLASQCDMILATQSADVGSIGIYLGLLDSSRAMEMEGLRVELFKSGKFKGMGFPGTSLTDAQRELLQERVDRIFASFSASVRQGRAESIRGKMEMMEISDESMQGQSFDAATALQLNLVDGINTIAGALREAQALGRTQRAR